MGCLESKSQADEPGSVVSLEDSALLIHEQRAQQQRKQQQQQQQQQQQRGAANNTSPRIGSGTRQTIPPEDDAPEEEEPEIEPMPLSQRRHLPSDIRDLMHLDKSESHQKVEMVLRWVDGVVPPPKEGDPVLEEEVEWDPSERSSVRSGDANEKSVLPATSSTSSVTDLESSFLSVVLSTDKGSMNSQTPSVTHSTEPQAARHPRRQSQSRPQTPTSGDLRRVNTGSSSYSNPLSAKYHQGPI